jgi:hypothetical protein
VFLGLGRGQRRASSGLWASSLLEAGKEALGAGELQDLAFCSSQEWTDVQIHFQPVVWNSGVYFPTETKLKWRLASCLAQKRRIQLTTP